jgi:hypothetical protein
MPLVATNTEYRRQGMCRRLVDTIERVLSKITLLLLLFFLKKQFHMGLEKLEKIMTVCEKFLVQTNYHSSPSSKDYKGNLGMNCEKQIWKWGYRWHILFFPGIFNIFVSIQQQHF